MNFEGLLMGALGVALCAFILWINYEWYLLTPEERRKLKDEDHRWESGF